MFAHGFLLSLLCSLPSQAAPPRAALTMDRTVLAMGTELRIHLEGEGDLRLTSEAALAESARIEAACSTWNPASAWSRLNAAKGQSVGLEPEWLALLAQMKAWSRRTGGAFDPTLMALMRAWRIREGGQEPAPEVLVEARRASGAHLLEVDLEGGSVRLLDPWAGLEEGGFLKGYALDRMRKAASTTTGWIDFGGQVLTWGPKCQVFVADPCDRQVPRLGLNLQNASLSCSGTSERSRHILDPRSGLRCEAWGATAVVAPEALTADILSTALFVLGPDKGLAWAERHDMAAAFLLNDGRVRMTRAFRALKPTQIAGTTR